MVICFDSTAEAKKALDALVETGQFKDISEAISMALLNYHIIHRAVAKSGQILLGETAEAQKSPAQEETDVGDGMELRLQSGTTRETAPHIGPAKVPDVFTLKSKST